MSKRPVNLPRWANVPDIDPITLQNNVVEPPDPSKDVGWMYQQSPAYNQLNWLHNTNYEWHDYIAEHIDQFAVIEQAIPDDTVQVTAGIVRAGIVIMAVASQSTGAIVFPTTNPRIDRVVLDSSNNVQVITGAEAPSPVSPAISSTDTTLAKLNLIVGQTEIKNTDIEPERVNPYQAQSVMGAIVATDALASYQLIDGLALEYDIGSNEGMITATGVGAVDRGIELRALNSGVPNANQIFLDPDGGVVFGAPGAGSLGAGTVNIQNQLGIGTSVDSGVSLHVEAAANEKLRLESTSTTGNLLISFYQTTTRRAHINFSDTNDDFQFASKYGRLSIWTDSAGSEALRGYVDPDGGLVWGAPGAGSLGAGTGNFENQIAIGASVDSGIPFHIESSLTSKIKLQSTIAGGNSNILFYQTTTLRGIVGFSNSNASVSMTSQYGRIEFFNDSAGAPTLSGYIDPDNGLVWGAPGAGSLGAGTGNFENQIAIGASVDSGIALHIEGDATEKIRLQNINATGNNRVSFYQTTTNRAFIQHQDSNNSLDVASLYGRVSFLADLGGAQTLRGYVDPDGGVVFGAPGAGSLGAGTVNIQNQLGIGTSVDSGVSLHVEGSANELMRVQSSSATGEMYIHFYQTTTKRGAIEFSDTDDDLRIRSDYGRVSIWTGAAGSSVLRGYADPDGGGVWGAASGGSQGAGTFNFQNGVFEGGVQLPRMKSGNFTTASIGAGAVSTTQTITHGLGTDNVAVLISGVGNTTADQWYASTALFDGTFITNIGRVHTSLGQIPVTPATGDIKINVRNTSGSAQTVTIQWTVIARD